MAYKFTKLLRNSRTEVIKVSRGNAAIKPVISIDIFVFKTELWGVFFRLTNLKRLQQYKVRYM